MLLAVVPYLAALYHPFSYDDYAQVVRNDLVRSLDLWRVLVVGSVTHGQVEWYRPLTIYSFALNYAATGLEPWSYRLVNLALHAANTALVLAIGRAIGTAAGAAAALFAVHAVHSEAVIPAFGRADLLSLRFALDGLSAVDTGMREWIGLVAYRATGKTSELFPGPAQTR